MRLPAVLCATIALAACTSASHRPGKDEVLGGEAGDLRILMDGACPQARPAPLTPDRQSEDKGLFDDATALPGLALNMLSSISGIAFQSFGAYLKQAGEEDVTRSVGANGGLFYTSPQGGDVSINPDMRCIYLVRNGYAPQPKAFKGEAPVDLKTTWDRLGLTRTPDLFAALYIQTSGDVGGGAMMPGKKSDTRDEDEIAVPPFWNPAISPPYFRLKLNRLYIAKFQSPTSATSRDLALIFNYGIAAARTTIKSEGPAAGVPDVATRFAVGGIRLAGARPGDYNSGHLTALQSAWMPVPGVKGYDPRATVDVAAYVVEFAPGNPMLEEIGEYLAGAEVRKSVENAVAGSVNPPR